MPIYEYRCDNGHTFEVLQKFSDDPLEKCDICGAPARRVLHPVAIHFKGSGFYTTDYGRGKTAAKADGSSSSSGDGGGESAKPSTGESSTGGSSSESTPKKAAEA